MFDLCFNFYGVFVRFRGDEEVCRRIENDFLYFKKEKLESGSEYIDVSSSVQDINIINEKIYTAKKYKKSYTFRDIQTYDNSSVRYNIYEQKCISIYDFKNEIGQISGLSIDLVHEISYLLILSRVGKKHDQMGIHRLHSMFSQRENNSIVGIGASGVGKSTLLINLLKRNCRFGADDTVLVNNKGEFFPFPIRVGISQQISDVKYDFVLERRQYGLKYLYNFINRSEVASVATRPYIVLLERGENKFEVTNKLKLMSFLVKFLVIGIGTPQIFEYFWEKGFLDYFTKFKILFSRIRTMLALMRNKSYLLRSDDKNFSVEKVDYLLK